MSRILTYGIRAQLQALAKLCGRDENFDDWAEVIEARRKTQKVLEKAYEAGKVTEEQVPDGALALWRAYMWMYEYDECEACYKRAGSRACLGRTVPRRFMRPL